MHPLLHSYEVVITFYASKNGATASFPTVSEDTAPFFQPASFWICSKCLSRCSTLAP